jgi:hypothetical protein
MQDLPFTRRNNSTSNLKSFVPCFSTRRGADTIMIGIRVMAGARHTIAMLLWMLTILNMYAGETVKGSPLTCSVRRCVRSQLKEPHELSAQIMSAFC